MTTKKEVEAKMPIKEKINPSFVESIPFDQPRFLPAMPWQYLSKPSSLPPYFQLPLPNTCFPPSNLIDQLPTAQRTNQQPDSKTIPLEQNFIPPKLEEYYNKPYNHNERNIAVPNIININNVNAMGNTYIIYGNKEVIEPHFNNIRTPNDEIFKITIDKEYYNSLYSPGFK